jgi:hypothetical protein
MTTAALTRPIELDPHLSLAQLVRYSGLSLRTPRGYVDGRPGAALPGYRDKSVVERLEDDRAVQQVRSSRLPRR